MDEKTGDSCVNLSASWKLNSLMVGPGPVPMTRRLENNDVLSGENRPQ